MNIFNYHCEECKFLEICKSKDIKAYEEKELGCEPYSLSRAVMTHYNGTDEQKKTLRNSKDGKKSGYFEWVEKIYSK